LSNLKIPPAHSQTKRSIEALDGFPVERLLDQDTSVYTEIAIRTKEEFLTKFETADRPSTKLCCLADMKLFRSSYMALRPTVQKAWE
jgi:hypothetical protein